MVGAGVVDEGLCRSGSGGALSAAAIQGHGVIENLPALGLGDQLLAFFDFGIIKLLNLAAVGAYQMVVVLAFVELVHRFATFKVAAQQNASLFKLGEHPVHRGQSNIRAIIEQDSVHILCGQVAQLTFLENLHDFQARQGGFEPRVFQFVYVGHGR